MGSDRDTPMAGEESDGEVAGSKSFVGPSAPDDAIDAGETGAEARSEQKRHASQEN